MRSTNCQKEDENFQNRKFVTDNKNYFKYVQYYKIVIS